MEPSLEQPGPHGLPVVGRITHVQQYAWIGTKELLYDANDCVLEPAVTGRIFPAPIVKIQPIGVVGTYLLVKYDGKKDAMVGSKEQVLSILPNDIRRMHIEAREIE